MTEIIRSLADIADRYDALLCDVWGVYHNGIRPYAAAVSALQAFRAGGGAVALLTNAPRPEETVARQLAGMDAPSDSWDAIASSGGAAQDAVQRGDWGTRIYHIGDPSRDMGFFEGADVTLVPPEEADSLVCTGLANDKVETPADYDSRLTEAKLRGLKMLCANPDLVVDVGGERRYCAGSLAQLYREKGGDVMEYGKPHPQIYDYARALLTERTGKDFADDRILCIGDGVRTDVAGAMGEGLDCLFVAAGLAASDIPDVENPDPDLVQAYLQRHGMDARWTIGFLR